MINDFFFLVFSFLNKNKQFQFLFHSFFFFFFHNLNSIIFTSFPPRRRKLSHRYQPRYIYKFTHTLFIQKIT